MAGVAKSVDAGDLKSPSFESAGSSPAAGTILSVIHPLAMDALRQSGAFSLSTIPGSDRSEMALVRRMLASASESTLAMRLVARIVVGPIWAAQRLARLRQRITRRST